MKIYYSTILFILFPYLLSSQIVEVDGYLELQDIDTIITGNHFSISQADGTVASRTIYSLPAVNGVAKNWQSDLLFESTICHCGTLHPATLQNLIAYGYTIQEFLEAGLTPDQLYNAGVSIQVLRENGLSVQQLHAAGISSENLHLGGVKVSKLRALKE